MNWIAILTIFVLGGCVPYPVYKTLQPELEIAVVDDQNEPIQGAIVALISSSSPYGWEKGREVQTTDKQGIVKFLKRREWRIEALMLHGVEIFYWKWCVKMEGFVTYEIQGIGSKIPRSKILIDLEPGESEACAVPYGLQKL